MEEPFGKLTHTSFFVPAMSADPGLSVAVCLSRRISQAQTVNRPEVLRLRCMPHSISSDRRPPTRHHSIANADSDLSPTVHYQRTQLLARIATIAKPPAPSDPSSDELSLGEPASSSRGKYVPASPKGPSLPRKGTIFLWSISFFCTFVIKAPDV